MAGQTLSLRQILGRLRRRFLWIAGASGVGWGLVVAVICLLAAGWLDLVLELSPGFRIATEGLSASAAIALLIGLTFWAFRKSVFDVLARRLDLVAGTEGQIRSGADLSRPQEQSFRSANPAITTGLAAMAVNQAARLAGEVPHSRAVPARPIRRSFGTFVFLIAAAAALVLTMPRLAMTQWLRFSDPFGDHPPFSRVIFHVEPQGANVVYGDGLEIHVTVEGPAVDRVELVLHPQRTDGLDSRGGQSAGDQVLPMFPESGRRWRAAISNITVPMQYFVRARSARSHKFTIRVITLPKIEKVRFRVTAPKYTGVPVYEGDLPQGGLAGLPGPKVELWAQSNRPLAGGTLTFSSKEEQQVTKLRSLGDGADEVAGAFEIRTSGRIDVRVVDEAGQESTDSFSAPVTLLVDEHPFVRLLEPRAVSLATPTAVVPVVISAEDDFGISRGQLFRSLNDSRYLPMEIEIPKSPPTRFYRVIPLPLADYGLEPGDEIKLFARVVDNDPGAGVDGEDREGIGKGAESSIVVIRIISQEDFERMQRTRDGLQILLSKYQQAQRRMESIAEELENLQKQLEKSPADSKMAEQQREQIERLMKQMQEQAEAIRKLSESKLPYDLDRELTPHLQKLANSLDQLAKELQSLTKKSGATNRDAAKQLANMLRTLRQQREQLNKNTMLPLELLAAVYPLSEDEMRFVQIYLRQRNLAERLSSLKGRDDEDDPALKARMRELEEEQQRIRDDLANLLDDIEDHVVRLPDDRRLDGLRKTALDFVEAIRSSGASAAMIEAENGLSEFSGTRGHAGAKKAADILERFLKKCQGMGMQGEGGACLPRFQPGLSNCLSQTVGQLLADAGFGFGQGPGFGRGAGGGYSARRSTLQNIGLYGGFPQLDPLSSQGARLGRQAQLGNGRRALNRVSGQTGGAVFDSSDSLNASGAGEAAVPLRYRRKVGRYFQRIADEIGNQ